MVNSNTEEANVLTGGGVRGGNLGTRQREGQCAGSGEQPCPDSAGCTAGDQGVGESGQDGGVQARDTQGEAEARPQGEFALEHLEIGGHGRQQNGMVGPLIGSLSRCPVPPGQPHLAHLSGRRFL